MRQPHQYCLHLRVIRDPVVYVVKPHLIYRSGRWRLFRNRWKSQFYIAAQIAGDTIPQVIEALERHRDRYRFGYAFKE